MVWFCGERGCFSGPQIMSSCTQHPGGRSLCAGAFVWFRVATHCCGNTPNYIKCVEATYETVCNQLSHSHLMIIRIVMPNLIIVFKSEICFIGHCLRLGHEARPLWLLSGVPDLWDRNKILSCGDLSHLHVPDCIWVFFYFVWFVFIDHNFQCYFELCTYSNILDIYLL